MYADLFANVIVLTKSEAHNAGKPGTDEYTNLMKLRTDFPGYPTKIAPAPKKTNRLKGLDYPYMEKYIKENKSELITEFYELCGKDADGKKKEMAATATYGEVKMWFLAKFPDIEKMEEKINKIVEDARKAREEARKVG